MWWFKEQLTIGTSQWYETLPIVAAIVFMTIDLASRAWHRRPFTRRTPYDVIFAGGEGASVAVIATYAPALLFYKDLAAQMAIKNDKILCWAMFCACVALQHFYDSWTGKADH